MRRSKMFKLLTTVSSLGHFHSISQSHYYTTSDPTWLSQRIKILSFATLLRRLAATYEPSGGSCIL